MFHGMPFDPKLQVVAKRAGQPMGFVVVVWVCILDAASQHDPRGIAEIDPEEIAVVQGLEVEAVEAILHALIAKNLMDEDGYVTAWDTRQRSSSTERSRKQRTRKKKGGTQCNTVQRNATKRDSGGRKKGKKSPDTDTEGEESTEEEQEKESDSEKRARDEKRESEREKHEICGKESEKPQSQILQEMADIWNEEVQNKITPDQKVILTQKRKELLTLRWIDQFAEDMEAWRYFCQIIGSSEFALGKKEGKGWTITLTSAIQSEDRIADILEGAYSDGKHPPRRTRCELPEYDEAWKEVLRRMKHHHGKRTIDGWFANTAITGAEETSDGVLLTLRCARSFARDWIERHYLTDLNYCWAEQSRTMQPVIGMQLLTGEVSYG